MNIAPATEIPLVLAASPADAGEGVRWGETVRRLARLSDIARASALLRARCN
jgi:hypothetical protein